MNKFIAFLFFSWAIGSAQIINIPDANFKSVLLLASTTNTIACIGDGFLGFEKNKF